MSVDPRTFRKALGCFPTGVTVVTTLTEAGHPVGVTISAFSSLSLEPPLVLFCLAKNNANLDAFKGNGKFVINVLQENQRDYSIRFSSRLDEKWAGISYDTWDSGIPVLQGCLANLECTITAIHDGGDHSIFVGEVTRLEHKQAGQPLIYFRGAYAELGCPASL